MSRIRIVVADQAEAIFYDTAALSRRPREVARITDPTAHLHERDLASDRPGRTHPTVGTVRHAYGPEPHIRRLEATRFARRIARRLDEARRRHEYEDLVLVAGPRFLGELHRELSRLTSARVVHEIPKDLVHSTVPKLQQHLPRDEDLPAGPAGVR